MRVEGAAELGQGFGVRVYRVLVLGGFRTDRCATACGLDPRSQTPRYDLTFPGI